MNDKTSSRDESADPAAPEEQGAPSSDAASAPPPDRGTERSASAAAEPAKRPGSGRGLAWLAFLLALPGAAFVIFWMLQQPDQGMESTDWDSAIGQQIEAAMVAPLERLDNQAAALADLERQQQTIGGDLDALQRELGEVSDGLERLQRSLDEAESVAPEWEAALLATRDDFDLLAESLEARMAAFAEQAGEQREFDRELARRLQLMEAAALLQMGQHRLELADDLPGARRAFRAADALIQRLDEPRLAPVRRQLLAELEALDGHQQPDWMALSARLGRIADQVNGWPLRPALAEAAGMEISVPESEDGRMDELRRSLRQLVQVRPREGLPVDESRVQWVREQVRLRLATIEWGLARRDWSIVEAQMAPLSSLVDEWFEPGSPAMADFQAVMNDLQRQARTESPPALGAALSALREQMDRS